MTRHMGSCRNYRSEVPQGAERTGNGPVRLSDAKELALYNDEC